MRFDTPRRLVRLAGSRDDILPRASSWALGETLWVSDALPGAIPCSMLKRHLGRGYDTVILDFHGGFRAEVIAMALGMVRGGGHLVLLDDISSATWVDAWPALIVEPFSNDAVVDRTRLRFADVREPAQRAPAALHPPDTAEQDHWVTQAIERWRRPGGSLSILTAARGRGKSAALGRLLHAFGGGVVAAPYEEQAREVLSFSPASEFRRHPRQCRRLAVDEAAAWSVPALQQLVHDNPDAHIVFATTTEGYEGTGRGFTLGFVPWLERQTAVHRSKLNTPIRWSADDPLEADVFRRLVMDATPHRLGKPSALHIVRMTGEALAENEHLLRGVMGLLVHAHYRTTPGDLQRLLDAPNLDLFVALEGNQVVGVNLVAHEGNLSESACDRLDRGERLRGHVLAEAMGVHLGETDLLRRPLIRSVRIATHPNRRRHGIGRRLVEAVHDAFDPSLFGTVFSATAPVVRFRRTLGYRVVRIGLSRSARTGCPAVVMVRSADTHRVDELQARLAGGIPHWVPLARQGPVPIPRETWTALTEALPEFRPWSLEHRTNTISRWIRGRVPFASAVPALATWNEDERMRLPPRIRDALAARISALETWQETADRLGLAGVPATMRHLRNAVRLATTSDPAVD